jgi:hypothetical protein
MWRIFGVCFSLPTTRRPRPSASPCSGRSGPGQAARALREGHAGGRVHEFRGIVLTRLGRAGYGRTYFSGKEGDVFILDGLAAGGGPPTPASARGSKLPKQLYTIDNYFNSASFCIIINNKITNNALMY